MVPPKTETKKYSGRDVKKTEFLTRPPAFSFHAYDWCSLRLWMSLRMCVIYKKKNSRFLVKIRALLVLLIKKEELSEL